MDLFSVLPRIILLRTGRTEGHPLEVCLLGQEREEGQEQPAGASDRPAGEHLPALHALLWENEPLAVIALREVGDHDTVCVLHGVSYSVGPVRSGTLLR